MKKNLIFSLLALVLLLGAATPTFSQEIRASKVIAASVANESEVSAIATGAEASATKYQELLILTTEMPVTFAKFTPKDEGNGFEISGAMSVGASYVLMYGKGELQADNSVKNYRAFLFGGPACSLDFVAGSTLYTGFTVGGVIGINPISAIIGYDVIQKEFSMGLGLKIDLLSITDATTVVLKRWNDK